MTKTDEQIKQMWLEGQRNELATMLKGIAVAIAEKMYVQSMRGTDIELDDVISWALESMWKAIEGWDPDNVPLRGWIAFRVRRDIIDTQKYETRQKRGADWDRIPIDFLEDRGEPERFEDTFEHDTNNQLAHTMPAVRTVEDAAIAGIDAERALEELPEQQKQILRGLAEGASLRDIGKALGISHEWARIQAEKARESVRDRLT